MENSEMKKTKTSKWAIAVLWAFSIIILGLSGTVWYQLGVNNKLRTIHKAQIAILKEEQQIKLCVLDTIIEEKEVNIKRLEEESVYLRALSPLIGLVSDDDIKNIIDEIPMGKPFVNDKYQITSSFGESTGFFPRLEHKGTDVIPKNPETADWSIFAYAPGEVVSFGIDHMHGKNIVIQHSPRVRTRYSHLSKIYYTGTTGEIVTADTRIGVMGNTGNSTAAHLHFEIQVKVNVDTWVPIDAKPFLIKEW